MSGFTLLELLIVISISLLLVTVSTTTFNSFKSHNNLEIATGSIVEAIRLKPEDGRAHLIFAEICLAKDKIEEFYVNFESSIKNKVRLGSEFEDLIYDKVRNDERFIGMVGNVFAESN